MNTLHYSFNHPYSITMITAFFCKLSGIDDDEDEKKKLVDFLNDNETYKKILSARKAYHGFCYERLLLVLQIEYLMGIKPGYHLSSDIYNNLEYDRGITIRSTQQGHHINPWTNLNQNPCLNAFILYIKNFINEFPDSTGKLLLPNISQYTGVQNYTKIKKEKILECDALTYGFKYKKLGLQYGICGGTWVSPLTKTDLSVEICALDYFRQNGWNGLKFNKNVLNVLTSQENRNISSELKNMLTELTSSLGAEVISKITNIFHKNEKQYKNGWPDLIIWNENKVFFIEVKEPHDSLTDSQKKIASNFAQPLNLNFHLLHIYGLFEDAPHENILSFISQ